MIKGDGLLIASISRAYYEYTMLFTKGTRLDGSFIKIPTVLTYIGTYIPRYVHVYVLATSHVKC